MHIEEFSIPERELVEFKKRRYIRQLVSVAIKKKELVKPDICELCDKAHHDIDAHHVDYGRPFDVVWLCQKCHGVAHTQGHALNPANNSQTPLPAIFEKYSSVTVAFTLPVKNFLALKTEAARQNTNISELMRREAMRQFPVLCEQLEFNFIGETNGTNHTKIENERVYDLETDDGRLLESESQIIQAVWG